MGAGGSRHYKSHAEREADRVAREERARQRRERRREEQRRKEAEAVARDAWIKNYRAAGGGARGKKMWWNSEWWPLYSWWKERSAWKAELQRRRRTGEVGDGILLKPHRE